ncbi:hypothetical protein PanWU01x14_082160 [Parasponia andersonii]|uniref:Uncharacterized protein n=1 Tax=Parasponia andersonii TaxID=3476 RepID=A0A2P5DAI9_PARAD|nr:hypothetical protein PanWU01x14_082160 [Parasponia andersonii]
MSARTGRPALASPAWAIRPSRAPFSTTQAGPVQPAYLDGLAQPISSYPKPAMGGPNTYKACTLQKCLKSNQKIKMQQVPLENKQILTDITPPPSYCPFDPISGSKASNWPLPFILSI